MPRYRAYHGTPLALPPAELDPARGGHASGYDHAAQTVCLTSELEVAQHYAGATGSVGAYVVELARVWELDDAERPMGIRAMLRHAREDGYDGLLLRGCQHSAISPGQPSDCLFVLTATDRPRLLHIAWEGERPDEAPPVPRRRGGR